jgi:hypothetical protein
MWPPFAAARINSSRRIHSRRFDFLSGRQPPTILQTSLLRALHIVLVIGAGCMHPKHAAALKEVLYPDSGISSDANDVTLGSTVANHYPHFQQRSPFAGTKPHLLGDVSAVRETASGRSKTPQHAKKTETMRWL